MSVCAHFAESRPQLDEEAPAEEAPAEEAPAEEGDGLEAAIDQFEADPEGETAAAPAGGQTGEVECFAAEKCLGTYNQDKVSAEGIVKFRFLLFVC